MSILLDHLVLATPGQDVAQDFYVHRLDQAIPRVFAKMQDQINATLFAEIVRQSAMYQALPSAIRRDILTHPYFSYWWVKLMEKCLEKQREPVEQWLQEFSRFLLVPCLRCGIWGGDPLPITVNLCKELRFPGHSYHITLGDWPVQNSVVATHKEGVLVLQGPDISCQIALSDFLGEGNINGHSRLKKRVILADTQIELDGGDLWVKTFFNSKNLKPPQIGYPPRNLSVTDPVPQETISYFAQAIHLLNRIWPELIAELYAYTRVIVPFRSTSYSTFTEAVFMGALFMGEGKHPFSDILYTAEHLLHEHSHLRLTILMESSPLFHADAAALHRSPFRRDPRPVIGIYQGAFVFARIAHFLRKCEKMTGEPRYRQRLKEVVVDLQASVKLLREIEKVTYTSMGQALLDQIEVESVL